MKYDYNFIDNDINKELEYHFTNLNFTQSQFIEISIFVRIDELKKSIENLKKWINETKGRDLDEIYSEYFNGTVGERIKYWNISLKDKEKLLVELQDMADKINQNKL